jgi:hypothetical protein
VAFPLTWSGYVVVSTDDASRLTSVRIASNIEAEILRQRPRSIERLDSFIMFRGGIFRLVLSSNTLVAITSGRVEVSSSPSEVRMKYEIRFTEMLVVCSIATVIFAIAAELSATNASIWFRFAAPCLPAAWLFGGNVVIAIRRFRQLLRRAATTGDAV